MSTWMLCECECECAETYNEYVGWMDEPGEYVTDVAVRADDEDDEMR